MRLVLAAIGQRMPAWVEAGFGEYVRRMPPHLRLELVERPASPWAARGDAERGRREEALSLRAAVPAGARLVALDERGSAWSTRELADQLERWQSDGRDVALLVGGPDGLEPDLRAHADQRWSLSPLTLPHPLVRVVVVEQLYRAHTLLVGHPYHRSG
ncbi:MAG: 23S rRNA (pseudouridine(1915)-N(3))-methyltransferase RlmH [Xanthomonadales bacterium]|nr:23S rRNA (pseudouridine(1915)-N(3))-methyltransferase RlmH [Xanthomonadales bacterium]